MSKLLFTSVYKILGSYTDHRYSEKNQTVNAWTVEKIIAFVFLSVDNYIAEWTTDTSKNMLVWQGGWSNYLFEQKKRKHMSHVSAINVKAFLVTFINDLFWNMNFRAVSCKIQVQTVLSDCLWIKIIKLLLGTCGVIYWNISFSRECIEFPKYLIRF